jgi:hypothetical protein
MLIERQNSFNYGITELKRLQQVDTAAEIQYYDWFCRFVREGIRV